MPRRKIRPTIVNDREGVEIRKLKRRLFELKQRNETLKSSFHLVNHLCQTQRNVIKTVSHVMDDYLKCSRCEESISMESLILTCGHFACLTCWWGAEGQCQLCGCAPKKQEVVYSKGLTDLARINGLLQGKILLE